MDFPIAQPDVVEFGLPPGNVVGSKHDDRTGNEQGNQGDATEHDPPTVAGTPFDLLLHLCSLRR